ncbi:MAG: hypothetical protein Q9184_008094, partial [Pyrenodesmia sp. 2 TL-2023]
MRLSVKRLTRGGLSMSGIATLGVLASVTQLAAYSIKIVLHLDEIYAAFQNTSARTKGHFKQIKELIEITTLIEQQKNLWSPAVNRQLQATLSEAQILYDLLRELASKYSQNSIWKYWSILSRVAENQIQSSLDNLERQKSTLRLCIDTVHTDLLLSIKGSIDTLPSADMDWLKKQKNTATLQTSASNPNAGPNPTQQEPRPVSNRIGDTDSSSSQGQNTISYPTTQEQHKLMTVQKTSTSTSNVTGAGHQYVIMTDNQPSFGGHEFKEVYSSGSSTAHAGDIYEIFQTTNLTCGECLVDYEQQQSNQFNDLTGPARGDKLLEFAADGAKSGLKTLLQLQVDLEYPEASSNKALHYALRNGETECARLLVNKGADVNARDESGQTPLFISTSQGDRETVLFLLKDGGAKPDIRDERGMTPLMAASSGVHHGIDYAIVGDLLEHRANVQEADDNGWTALHYAAKHGQHRLCGRLLRNSANIHASGNPEQRAAI